MSIKAIFNAGNSYSIHATKLYFWISLIVLGIKWGINISWRLPISAFWNDNSTKHTNYYIIYIFMSISELCILSLILLSYLVIMSDWFSKYIFYCIWANYAGALDSISLDSISLPFLEQRTWVILYIYHDVLEETSLHGPQHP